MNVLELIGVAAFAITGAMAAIEKDADIFGVLFLSLITALGGGVIRDLLLGVHPPRMFASFAYVALALGCGLVFFLGAWLQREHYLRYAERIDRVINVFDALGLAVFTVSGVKLSAEAFGMGNPLLLAMMGMTTGIGGGMLRDMMIGVIPRVLRRRIYAVASILGALCYWALLRAGAADGLSAALACVLVVALRLLATHFRWNLPSVKL